MTTVYTDLQYGRTGRMGTSTQRYKCTKTFAQWKKEQKRKNRAA